MDTSIKTKKAMSRDEVGLLVNLVISKPILTSKETNAATNKLKEDAWLALTDNFNAISGQMRSKDQIKLKWDNLKKAARKRIHLMSDNNLKTDRGTPNFVTPDDILEKVSGIIGSSRSESSSNGEWVVVDRSGEGALKRKSDSPIDESVFEKFKQTKFQTQDKLQGHTGKKEGTGAKERNQAIAKYYEKKAEKVELEIQLLKMQLNKCNCNISNFSSSDQPS